MKTYNIKDYRLERWDGFKDYYVKMMYSGDCDPAYPALNYISDRLELNLEQRYWLAFLYGTNYCAINTYYIFNEFPDFENVDINRMQRWWDKNKQKTYFQTDRAKVKNFDLFVKVFESYRNLIGNSQVECFNRFFEEKNLEKRYELIYNFTNNIYYFGRFTLFNYLETISELTPLKMEPHEMDFKEAESSRNGMCYICNKDSFITLHHKKPLEPIDYPYLQNKLETIKIELQQENPEIEVNYWNIETCLCAYKKLFWNSRYLGYYIDRQMEEILRLESCVKEGVEWKIFWDFREEFFDPYFLGEKNDWKRIRKENMRTVTKYGKLTTSEIPELKKYSRKIKFEFIGNIYDVKEEKNNLEIVKIRNKQDIEEIKKICKLVDNTTVRSFPNIWTKFNNWEKNPPYIVLEDKEIVGFMGFTINKNEYINFYDFAVLPDKERKGIGSLLWNKVLEIAQENNKTRIKTSAHEDYSGYHFFRFKLNWNPIAKKRKEFKFNAFIENINNLESFINSKEKHKIPDEKELNRYKKMDEYLYDSIPLNKEKGNVLYWLNKK